MIVHQLGAGKRRVEVRISRRGEHYTAGKVIRTTLGDLVVAVTDEVMPVIRKPSGGFVVVSFIVNDLLAQYQARADRRPRRKHR
jgi:hypothetical protein